MRPRELEPYTWFIKSIYFDSPIHCPLPQMQEACSTSRPRRPENLALQAQHLFSIYVHSQPGFPGYCNGSLFRGREIPTRSTTCWGCHNLASAAKRLLMQAMQDKRNVKFVLLSESDLPLHPPLVGAGHTPAVAAVQGGAQSGVQLRLWRPL